jgi:hypothetical protein
VPQEGGLGRTIYGHKEHVYADAFANALCDDPHFLLWVLKRTKFADRIGPFVLREEMIGKRPRAKFWWKNYWTGRCTCLGCSGSETDIFVVCGSEGDDRIALHIEVKQPTDRFDPAKRQGERYKARAACWAANPPKTVPQHGDAATLLICSQDKLATFADEISMFDSTITFETLRDEFPAAVPPVVHKAA